VEKAHDDEMKWRQRLRDAGALNAGRPDAATGIDPEPE
jgi:hypothetical protein